VLTGGSRVAAKEEVDDGLAGRVGPKSTAGCGLVNSREELGVL
jgi:hypothetical protein